MLLLTIELLSGPARAGTMEFGDGDGQLTLKSMREIRYSRVVAQQYDFSCGSAAVATLLTYGYDRKTDEHAAFQRMYDHGDKAAIQKVGFSLLDMRSYMVEQGFEAEGYKADLNTVKKMGVPVITLITTGTYHHFVVVRGIVGDRVLMADSSRGLRVVSRNDFEKMWTGVLLVVKNYADVGNAHFNDPADWRLVSDAPLSRGFDLQRRFLADTYLSLPLANEF